MKKSVGILGIFGLLVTIVLITAILEPSFTTPYNIQNTIRWTSLFGIISIGAAFVIITGGIDLSVGSVVGLVGVLLPMLLVKLGWSIPLALLAVLVVSLAIGLLHGLLITKMRLQPFVVTLCGLLFYRGFARWLTGDQTQGFGNSFDGLRQIAIGRIPITDSFGIPMPFVVLVVLAILAGIFLNYTIWGRYLLALGRNEEAARYSGINTERMIIVAYVIGALTAGIGGILFSLDVNSVQPAVHGNFYELYAIAAAVLGGCSLRGGEGTILGVIIGAAVMRVLYNAINILGIPTQLEFAIIGAVILLGVMADELVKRINEKRKRMEMQAASESV
ncbi:MAG: ABC transporter permease [Rhodothermaceae bacterium]|nr:ABC transporter permease [Rhodothermaceae bacterium]